MTDKQYLKKMVFLYDELAHVASSDPFDRSSFKDVHARIMALHFCWLSGRRRPSWFAIASIIFLLLMFAWIIYTILHEL